MAVQAERTKPLRGRRALVTGGESGIGEAICFALAQAGAAVAINYFAQEAHAKEMAAQIEAEGGTALPVQMDISKEAEVERAFTKAQERLGPIDLLVNNAGVEHYYLLQELELEAWRQVIDTNLTGAFLCTREAVRRLLPARLGGTVINVSSVHEQIPWEGFSHYCASKGALKLFAQSVAKELAPHGIRVVNVAPGAIETPINREVLADPKQSAAVRAEIPLGRWGKAAEIAQAVVWLASEEAAYVTGATLFVDGGMTLYPRFV